MIHKGNDGNFERAVRGLVAAMVEIQEKSDSEYVIDMARMALENWDHERGNDWVVETKKSLGLLKDKKDNG